MTDNVLVGRAAARTADSRRFSPAVAFIIVALIVALLGHYFWRSEGLLANIVFTAATTGALVALLTLATRRLMFSAAVIATFVAIIVVVATIKRQIMNMVVHAYDIFFYLSSWSTISFLWSDHRHYLLGLAAAVLALGLIGWIAFRLDPTRVRRSHAAMAAVLLVGLAWYGAAIKGERRHMQFHFENLLVSSFYASWGETLETLWRGQLVEAASDGGGRRFAIPHDTDCPLAQKPPHVILIHQESVVPPSIFPTLAYDRSIDPLFTSFDGRLHKLRVETYGGASWLTEFSILAGVSTHAFGGMRQFVQTFMEGKLKDTLPQAMARCGYRNVVFYPMLKNFVSNARFYQSIGLNEILDAKDQHAKRANERDRFYYANALTDMQRHIEASPQPLFTFIQTMSVHWPYDVTYEPDVKVPGGGAGTHPEMHEYLRRVALTKIDYDFLKAELTRRFPNERFLLVQYGDHQPTSTRMLIGYREDTDIEDLVMSPESPGFITYFAVEGINYQPPPLPAHDVVDVPYLGSVILEAAGLPLSDAHRERLQLMRACNGRYHSCSARKDVLVFHRRLINSGVMQAR